ncbi:response regulator receiver domain prtein (CheY-like) [Sulfurimonas gotlandica GD1]|uniref:Response regulator receiver domain prtein (CheY-like) n=1 Tax=Sulfurimonas gotlandica (strain DSM 19862 / JCM 16533 / GD1) TaxID=929558 RepID=B6BL15_SULGG|nr:response regulator [Sulfurimonas gotlandica]EDZ62013.1 two component transcriptional regulator, winged helix family [Sulfurimonas gotlandica GD1]EHP28747.1 response regulator receiver domain prtein (CheY-like) [Sulfurimonas gotlandica GD1]
MNPEVIKKIRIIGKSIKILYVEDDSRIASQVEKLLLKLFENITYVDNGIKGLAAYKQNNYDVVITDILMPEMDGIMMTTKIKKINPDQVIIVTSGYNDSEKLIKLIDLGVDRFVMKPIDVPKFLGIISKEVVNIYNTKRKILLEEKQKQKNLEKELVIESLFAPIVIFQRGIVDYANELFVKTFNQKNDVNIMLGTLFDDELLHGMNNNEILIYLNKNKNKNTTYSLLINNGDKVEYMVKVTQIKDSSKLMCFFLNLDQLDVIASTSKRASDELEIDLTTGLLLRNGFRKRIDSYRTNEIEYNAICFGLKHINEYIKQFGVSSLQRIYMKFSEYLVDNFSNLLEDEVIELFSFDTNQFVILVCKGFSKEVQDSLKDFLNNYSYKNENLTGKQSMSVDFLTCSIDKNESLDEVISEVDNCLYMLKS